MPVLIGIFERGVGTIGAYPPGRALLSVQCECRVRNKNGVTPWNYTILYNMIATTFGYQQPGFRII